MTKKMIDPKVVQPTTHLRLYKLLFLCFVFLVPNSIGVASIGLASIAYTEIEKMEKQVVQMINEERAKVGLAGLQEWNDLAICARNHSQNMAQKLVEFGHDGFQDRADEIQDIVFCTRFGENVAFSYNVKDHLKTAVRGWMKSPGHRKNILAGYEETGIGIAFSDEGEFYITQLFATRG